MALVVMLCIVIHLTSASQPGGEMALANVTRYAAGDLFSLIGTDCGPTRCMEVSYGTALAAMGGSGCVCQCRSETPAFREDQKICVNHIEECPMASFGRGATKLQIPFAYLPLKGQIIYPSKEIVFTDVANAVCAVTNAQYLSPSGWVTLRDLVDNDVPFGLYRDEGSTFLQWRGSAALHTRLEGRLVTAHVLCSAPTPPRLATSCAAFRVAGASHNALFDVRSIPFNAGETVTTESTTQNQGLSVLESLAIGVCALMLIFVYAAGIIFYIHYKKKQKRNNKDPELNLSNTLSTDNGSTLDSRIDMENMHLKTNPLLKISNLGSDFLNDAGLSDVSEHTEDTIDSSPNNTHKFQKTNSNVVSAMVHTRRKKPVRPSVRATSTPERLTERVQRRSASPDTLERAPHSDLSIVDYSLESNAIANQPPSPSDGEPNLRRKLYFNPVFFEIEHLKNPPPAAVEFLTKIREVMSIAKEKMTSKRFIPVLSDILEEESYHTIDLGWDIPCARRGRRFSAISLKRENSRRAVHCGGCPGCDSNIREQKTVALVRSNSCKTCVSEDYKQKIVRKWLDEVPLPPETARPLKSIAKVSGTPRVIESKKSADLRISPIEPFRNEDTIAINVTDSKVKEDLINKQVLDKTLNKDEIKLIIKTSKYDDEIIKSKVLKTKESGEIKDEQRSPTSNQVAKKSPSSKHGIRQIRKKLPPPPPPPIFSPEPPKSEEIDIPIPPEVKKKMEAVIRELNECRRSDLQSENASSSPPPKIIIPVVAADSHYYSDDNMLSDTKKREMYLLREHFEEYDSLERSAFKRRRFSLACGPELSQRDEIQPYPNIQKAKDRLSRSWRDVRKAIEDFQPSSHCNIIDSEFGNRSLPVNEIFINTIEPLYNNIPKPGPLTIQVRGSPVENRRNISEEFDPDTLDRKPKKDAKKRVDKILLKSGGSFKYKSTTIENNEHTTPPKDIFTRKIGSLRQIYEAKAKAQDSDVGLPLYERRGSMPYSSGEIRTYIRSVTTPDLIRQTEGQKDLNKPPIPPKQRPGSDLSPKYLPRTRESPPGERRRSSEERDKFPPYSRIDNINNNLNARRSGRRSARTRSRRTDLRKLCKTEDSGYLSTDSNESKRRARYLMQLKPRALPESVSVPIPVPTVTAINKSSPIHIESDTDDMESVCDGRSESGGESVETDSVFFGNFDESKQMYADLGLKCFEGQNKLKGPEQIDSGFMGETNIILSGDSDSEHRSIISIIAGRDGRASAASITKLDDPPYIHSVEC